MGYLHCAGLPLDAEFVVSVYTAVGLRTEYPEGEWRKQQDSSNVNSFYTRQHRFEVRNKALTGKVGAVTCSPASAPRPHSDPKP